MSNNAIDQLLGLIGPSIGTTLDGTEASFDLVREQGAIGSELAAMLLERNGGYSSVRSLLIRPLEQDTAPMGLAEWNAESGWRSEYEADLSGALFFAEDLFGEQFALRNGAVWRFDPETAEWSDCAPSLNAWAEGLLKEEGRPDLESPFAAAWQTEHGKLPAGKRLRPPIPFMFKESAELTRDDFRAIPENEVMGVLATIANAVHELPEGGKVVLRAGAKPVPARKRRWWWPFRSTE